MKSTSEVKFPNDFMEALESTKSALQIFQSMPPSHKKEYIESILEAKKLDTRKKRISSAIKMILEWKKRKLAKN